MVGTVDDRNSGGGDPTEPMTGKTDSGDALKDRQLAATEPVDTSSVTSEPDTVATTALSGTDERAHDSLTEGTVLRERFRILGVLGSGGMGTVYRATDLLKAEAHDEHTDIALKVLKPDIVDAELSFMALQREARRAQQLAHPNIVTVYDFDRADGVIYMTMEYMDGQPLDSLLGDHPEGLRPDRARRIAWHVAEGLAYAHKRGIVHSDLKPENVFVLAEGRAKILDFGIARAYRPRRKDFVEEAIRGWTPAYATPELMSGKEPTPADDVYALGCVLYEMFTGRHPFDSASGVAARKAALKPKRTGAFRRAEWAAIAASLNFNPGHRPADAAQFLKRFRPSPVRKSAMVVSTLAVAGAIAFALLFQPEPGPDIPFESLPEPTRQQVALNLNDARLFSDQGDYNSALQLYDAVLKAHPGNRDAVRGMNETAGRAITRIEQAHGHGELPAASAIVAIESLLGYDSLPGASRDAAHKALEQFRGVRE